MFDLRLEEITLVKLARCRCSPNDGHKTSESSNRHGVSTAFYSNQDGV